MWEVVWEKRRAPQIDTPSKRSRLAPRRNPYWQGISGGRGGLSLGYRKATHGLGSWVAKIVDGGSRVEETIGRADDDGADAPAMNYRAAAAAALDWGKRQYACLDGRREAGTRGGGPTVRTAVAAYVEVRKSRSRRNGADAQGRLRRHVLSDEKFAGTPLSKLRSATIEAWRDGLSSCNQAGAQEQRAKPAISPATVNRLLNDVRAALNSAAERHRRELPASLPMEIKLGTKALPVATNARKQILTEKQIAAAIRSAFEVNRDFGYLVLVAAATGARHSQIRTLTVGDVQTDQSRIMMPGSRKGRAARARPPVSVPVSPDVIDALAPILQNSGSEEPLLTRWAYRRAGRLKWEKDHRRPWGPAYEVEESWSATSARADLPRGTVMYALRHSSIVRGLRSGLPIRLVAALHDTSSEMIERHYAAYIVDATEELTRRAVLSVAAPFALAAAE